MIQDNPDPIAPPPVTPSHTFSTSSSIHKVESDLSIQPSAILPSSVEEPKSLLDTKASKSFPSNKGRISRMIKSFQRVFSTPNEKEVEFAQAVRLGIGKLDRTVDSFNSQARNIKQQERIYRDKNLFRTRFEVLSVQQGKLEETLRSAKNQLTELEKQLGSPNLNNLIEDDAITVYKLADLYRRYDSLPKEIEKLRDSVSHMEQSIRISQKLLSLDEKMVVYIENLQEADRRRKDEKRLYDNSTETWGSFKELNAQIHDLHQMIRQEIGGRADLKNDSRIRKLLQKEEKEFSSRDAHQLIKLVHPALVEHAERLSANAKAIENRRIGNLKKQAKAFKSWTSIYYAKAAQINDLEKSLYAPSIAEKISYRLNKNSRKIVEEKLVQAKTEMKDISKQMQAAGQFNSEELAWLKGLASKNESIQILHRIVNQEIKEAEQLAKRDELSQNLDQIRPKLDQFASLNSEIREVKAKLDAISGEVSKLSAQELLVFENVKSSKELSFRNPLSEKDELSKRLDELTSFKKQAVGDLESAIKGTFSAIQSIKSQRRSVPKTFDRLPLIRQFKLLTKTTSFHLNQKIDDVARAIGQIQDEELKKLTDELISTQVVKTIPKKIKDTELKEKIALLEFHVREYVKWTLAIDNAEKPQEGQNLLTEAAKEAIMGWRQNTEDAKKQFELLKGEFTSYSLNGNSQNLVNQKNQLVTDFEFLVEANTNEIRDYNEKKLKTINDVRGGIDSGYTAAWSESPTFRKPTTPSSLILSHTALKERDPENADSYQELLNEFELLDKALKTASPTLESFYTKDQSGAYILTENAERTPQTDETIATLREGVDGLKKSAEAIKWKITKKNSFKSSGGQSTLGEMSQQKFIATLDKIVKELDQLVEKTSKKE